jgi:pyruvate/2-oxoglutarate dehydrogenase complex dihydrolipoamide acyltransferase (E2) component
MIYKLCVPQTQDEEELRVLAWHKAVGDEVASDELLVELETAKALLELRSDRACVLRKIDKEAGTWAAPGSPLAWLSGTSDENLSPDAATELLAQVVVS